MFGHMEGAFTGAVREKKGLLEVAHGGTLFLDELTEMPHSIQASSSGSSRTGSCAGWGVPAPMRW